LQVEGREQSSTNEGTQEHDDQVGEEPSPEEGREAPTIAPLTFIATSFIAVVRRSWRCTSVGSTTPRAIATTGAKDPIKEDFQQPKDENGNDGRASASSKEADGEPSDKTKDEPNLPTGEDTACPWVTLAPCPDTPDPGGDVINNKDEEPKEGSVHRCCRGGGTMLDAYNNTMEGVRGEMTMDKFLILLIFVSRQREIANRI
jgi:hypothetical protein